MKQTASPFESGNPKQHSHRGAKAVLAAGVAALAAGCAATQGNAVPDTTAPPVVYRLADGSATAAMPFKVEQEAAGGSETTISPFVLQAKKLGKTVVFNVDAGTPGKDSPVFVYKTGTEYMTGIPESQQSELRKEGFAPDTFTLPVKDGSGELYYFSVPGQADGEYLEVHTDGSGTTSLELTNSTSELGAAPLPTAS